MRPNFKYAALGDSVTTGISGDDPLGPMVGYVHPLAQALRSRGLPVETHNLSAPGATCIELELIQIPRCLALKPDLVTLWIGINDLYAPEAEADFEGSFKRSIEKLSAGLSARLVVANLFDTTSCLHLPDGESADFSSLVRAMNAVIEREARRSGAALVDLSHPPAELRLVGGDCVHPSAEGYHWIAYRFIDTVLSVLQPAQA